MSSLGWGRVEFQCPMKSRTGGQAYLCPFPSGFVKDRICKKMWLVNDATALEKWPGVGTAVECGLSLQVQVILLRKGKNPQNLCFSRDSPDWGDLTHAATAHVVNPLKSDHDLSSLGTKLFMPCKVVNEIVYLTKSCQITLSLESCLENHRGTLTGMSTGMGEASSHSLRPGHLRKTDSKSLFLSL